MCVWLHAYLTMMTLKIEKSTTGFELGPFSQVRFRINAQGEHEQITKEIKERQKTNNKRDKRKTKEDITIQRNRKKG